MGFQTAGAGKHPLVQAISLGDDESLVSMAAVGMPKDLAHFQDWAFSQPDWPIFRYVSNESNSRYSYVERYVTVGRWQRCHLGRTAGHLTKPERWVANWLLLVNQLNEQSFRTKRHDLWLLNLHSALHPFSGTLYFPAGQYIKNQSKLILNA